MNSNIEKLKTKYLRSVNAINVVGVYSVISTILFFVLKKYSIVQISEAARWSNFLGLHINSNIVEYLGTSISLFINLMLAFGCYLLSKKSKQGDISYYFNHQSQIKRNLLHIQHQMKEIAASLRELSGVDPVLKVRFDDISNICVDIADAEGIGLDVLVGYDGIKDKRKIIDSMDYNKLRTGGGRYNSNISDEIIELNGLLDKIAQYRKELLIAIGNAI